ncbi:hypothetical protein GCM10019059_32420 [Camelimonas fluminis]|uniref:Helix-turn-helix domain-containing protein n=1 Tax=Camelimonas fluminis TaxID=1576911 RepID=A0ABV7UHJ6_9HYPH|nr:helix-turn-helix domain-containing protein [Camelimonas fluminis]GHE70107.1 hypothetical protein GCM10019059_32420 [Camelimonas fluminis]
MSIQAVGWALKQKIPSASAKFVLVAIANYADENGRCWPSQQALAADTSLSERSIRNAIHALEELGVIERIERRRQDGSRTSDAIQIVAFGASEPQPADFAGGLEKSAATTGKSCRDNRQMTTEQPADFAGLTTFEPSLNHQENHSSAASPPRRPESDDLFDQFWAAYPRRGQAANPKKPAREKFARAVKAGANPQVIIAAARRYADIERRAGRFDTEKVAQAMTWLNQQRWDDYAEQPSLQTAQAPGADQWVKRLEMHARGDWFDHWGPKPGQEGCRVPGDILATWRRDNGKELAA